MGYGARRGKASLPTGAYKLRSRNAARLRSRVLPVSASWGLSLVTPWDSVLGEEVRGLTALWIAGLLAILAFWSVLAGWPVAMLVPATAALLLGAVPYAAGFPPAHWSEWAAALAGAVIGSAIALRASQSRANL